MGLILFVFVLWDIEGNDVKYKKVYVIFKILYYYYNI